MSSVFSRVFFHCDNDESMRLAQLISVVKSSLQISGSGKGKMNDQELSIISF